MRHLFTLLVLLVTSGAAYAQADTTKYQNLKTQVLTETKEGGKLDFFTPIKGHEYDGVQIKPGLFTTKLGIALMNWGKGNYEMGILNVDDAFLIFSAYKGRPVNEREKEYIRMGFNRELDK